MAPAEDHLRISWAQHWEDVRLWRVLRGREPGFYVDVGAMDPSEDSVTRSFYERGWRGLNVEPNPFYAQRLRDERPLDLVEEVACGPERGKATLHVVTSAEGEHGGLTTLDTGYADRHRAEGNRVTTVAVEVAPLRELMESTPARDAASFHFLKVDVEGNEAAVLAGADLNRFRPLVVIVEAREPGGARETYAEGERILVDAGFATAADDGLNRWYVRSEDAHLAETLAPEVNPLLDGLPRRWWELRREQELVEGMQKLKTAWQDKSDELEAAYASRSWRVTAPLRSAGRFLRRAPRG
ncbi:MAG: FkbM family methyltransferase [Actinomycetota bacterium]|nr:FkbM family methyltransferase [Actinomycetota bacterium]